MEAQIVQTRNMLNEGEELFLVDLQTVITKEEMIEMTQNTDGNHDVEIKLVKKK